MKKGIGKKKRELPVDTGGADLENAIAKAKWKDRMYAL